MRLLPRLGCLSSLGLLWLLCNNSDRQNHAQIFVIDGHALIKKHSPFFYLFFQLRADLVFMTLWKGFFFRENLLISEPALDSQDLNTVELPLFHSAVQHRGWLCLHLQVTH